MVRRRSGPPWPCGHTGRQSGAGGQVPL